MRDTRFANKGADGVELDERAAGAADFTLRGSSLIGNGAFTSEDFDDGIDVDEGGEGDLVGRIRRSTASGNDGAGADLGQVAPGAGSVVFVKFSAAGNAEGAVSADGVTTLGAP